MDFLIGQGILYYYTRTTWRTKTIEVCARVIAFQQDIVGVYLFRTIHLLKSLVHITVKIKYALWKMSILKLIEKISSRLFSQSTTQESQKNMTHNIFIQARSHVDIIYYYVYWGSRKVKIKNGHTRNTIFST